MGNLLVMKDGSEIIRYADPQIPLYMTDGRLSDFSDMRAFCHWHDDIELTFALGGHMMYEVDGERIRLDKGGGIFIAPHQMHYGYSADGTDCSFLCIVFNTDILSQNKALRENYIAPLEQGGQFPFIALPSSDKTGKTVFSLTRELYRIRKRGDPGCELDEIAVLHHLWAELYRSFQSRLPGTVPGEHTAVASFKCMLGYLYKNYAKKITLEDIAGAGNTGRSTCCALFTKYTGRPPVDYLNSYRIEAGMNMLCTTDESITDIAFACGFASSSYFAEQFKKAKGCAPGEYRKKQRSRQQT